RTNGGRTLSRRVRLPEQTGRGAGYPPIIPTPVRTPKRPAKCSGGAGPSPRGASSHEREIEAAFDAAGRRKVGALFINIDPYFFSQREKLVALAARNKVPTIYPLREMVAAGGLMSYEANFPKAWRQAGL